MQGERRRFFRIDEAVKLSCQSLDEKTLDTAEKSRLPLMEGLESIGKDASKQLARVERFYPEVAAYVKTLESKLDWLARSFVLMQEPELMQQCNRVASISASGLAFDVETRVSVGEVLEIKMVLLSSMVFIVNPVKVVYCQASESSDQAFPWHMGVDFIDMGEAMREQLIRHVFNRQQEQRRRLR